MPVNKPPNAGRQPRRVRPARKSADAYHHGDLRQALVRAACQQVEQEGPDSLSLAQLARSLGVSQPAPYRHFADRDALLVAVATEGFRDFTQLLLAAMAGGSKAEVLSRMGQAYVAFGTERAGTYRLMFASPILRDTRDRELRSVARGSFELLVSAVRDTSGARGSEQRALRIWVALHGIVMLANQGLLRDGSPSVRLPELIEAVLDV